MAGLSQRVVASICSKFAALVYLPFCCRLFLSSKCRLRSKRNRKSSEPPSSISSRRHPFSCVSPKRFGLSDFPFYLGSPHHFQKGRRCPYCHAADVEVLSHRIPEAASPSPVTNPTTLLTGSTQHWRRLRLDWVSSINEQIVPCGSTRRETVRLSWTCTRITRVFRQSGVSSARLFEARPTDSGEVCASELWVPVGTRMVGFVHGSFHWMPYAS